MMTVNRERIKGWKEITSLDLDYHSLADAIATLESYRAEYGDNTRMERVRYGDGDGEYWAIMQNRDETDEEMNLRIKWEEKNHAYRMKCERERAEFDRLKALFGE
jgi:hypothetical protein